MGGAGGTSFPELYRRLWLPGRCAHKRVDLLFTSQVSYAAFNRLLVRGLEVAAPSSPL